jgi:hypothetical protein
VHMTGDAQKGGESDETDRHQVWSTQSSRWTWDDRSDQVGQESLRNGEAGSPSLL